MTASPNLIGIGSGLVAAVLFASLANNTSLAVMLFYLTPLPVLLAGMGWGVRAGALSCFTASSLVGVFLGVPTAAGFALFIGLPGAILSYMTLLRRQAPPPARPIDASVTRTAAQIEWYPLGHVIAWLALMAGGLLALSILLIGGDAESYRHAVRSLFDADTLKHLQSVLGPEFGKVEFERFVERFTRYILPAFAAIFWLLVMLANLWLATKSAVISGLLDRPALDFTKIDYPPVFVAGFFAAIGLAFASGLLGITGMAFLGAFGCAFLILGLAVVHVLLSRTQMKPFVLAILYAGLLLTPWIAPMLATLGVLEPFIHLRLRFLNQVTPPGSGVGPHR